MNYAVLRRLSSIACRALPPTSGGLEVPVEVGEEPPGAQSLLPELPASHLEIQELSAGQGVVVRREATCGIAADNLLTGPGSESVLGRLRTTFLCLLNG
jgi:hypothetical protein